MGKRNKGYGGMTRGESYSLGNFLPRFVFTTDGTCCKRRKHFPLLVLVSMSIVACGLYYATYFQAVTASWHWKSGQWFGLRETPQPGMMKRVLEGKQSLPYSVSNHGNNSTVSLSDGDTSRFKDEIEEESLERISCKLPKLDPMDESIIEFIKPPPDIDCADNSHPSIFRTDFHSTLIQMKALPHQNSQCCYKTLQRGNFSDKEIQFSRECFHIKGSEQRIPAEHEFIYIRCKNSSLSPVNHTKQETIIFRDMFAFVPLKPQVEARVSEYRREEGYRRSTVTVQSTNDSSRVRKMWESKGKKSRRLPLLEDRLSVVILGLDAQSHMNFLRQMPMSYDYLVRNLSAIGLHGYTKVSDNTFPNIVPLLSGLSVSELKDVCWASKDSHFDDCPFIWKTFAQRGYRTSFAEDSVWMGTFNYNKAGFLRQPTDYYLNPFTYLMAKKIGHETWGNSEICYGSRLGFEVLLEYLVKAAVTFGQKKRYFQFVWATSLFHDFLNNPKLGDKLLYLALDLLNRNNYFNQTLFLLLSDHGIRWGGIRSTYQGKIEERMPLAYFVFPKWFHHKYPHLIHNLRLNSKRLTTPFDIHELLKDLVYLESEPPPNNSSSRDSPRGLSLFQPIPLNRTCGDAEISDHWCVCNAMVTIPANTTVVKRAATYIVSQINKMLFGLGEYCAKLELIRINEAMRTTEYNQNSATTSSSFTRRTTENNMQGINKTVHERDRSFSANSSDISGKTNNCKSHNCSSNFRSDVKSETRLQLQLTIVTQPGEGIFEATVAGSTIDNDENNYEWQLSGDISRISQYGSQSACISNFILQKFCYCLEILDGVS